METAMAVGPPCDGEESALTSAAEAARVLIGLFTACSARAGLAPAAGAPLKRRSPAGGCKPRALAVAAAGAMPRGGADGEVAAPGTPLQAVPPPRRVVYYRPESRIDVAARTIMALLVARGESRWMREGALRAALGNTPDTSKGLRKLRTAGLVVRRGQGGRGDPYRYMIKSAFNALSPEAQRAPLLPDDDEAVVAGGGDSGATKTTSVLNGGGGIDAAAAKEEQADVAAGRDMDMAPCGVEALPDESADSSCEAPEAAVPALATRPAAPVLASWRAAVAV